MNETLDKLIRSDAERALTRDIKEKPEELFIKLPIEDIKSYVDLIYQKNPKPGHALEAYIRNGWHDLRKKLFDTHLPTYVEVATEDFYRRAEALMHEPPVGEFYET